MKLTIQWTKEKTLKYYHTLATIESSLAHLMDDQNRGFISAEAKIHLSELENKRAKILKEREETWRLMSRALWLKVGDENASFF